MNASGPIPAVIPPRDAFMTQAMAERLKERQIAGRSSPWLVGLTIRVVPVGSRVISPGRRSSAVIGDDSSIYLAPADSIVVAPPAGGEP